MVNLSMQISQKHADQSTIEERNRKHQEAYSRWWALTLRHQPSQPPNPFFLQKKPGRLFPKTPRKQMPGIQRRRQEGRKIKITVIKGRPATGNQSRS